MLRHLTRRCASLPRVPVRALATQSTGDHVVHRLPSRAMICVRGPDAVELVNGLVTQDVTHIAEGSGVPAMWLQPNGRLLVDSFVWREGPDCLTLDVHSKVAQSLQAHIVRHRLRARADVFTKAVDECSSWSVMRWSDDAADTDATPTASHALPHAPSVLASAPDPRIPGAVRVLSAASTERDAAAESRPSNGRPSGAHLYTVARMLNGCGEGAHELAPTRLIPLSAGADVLGFTSWEKGCYVGQELMARAHHTGVVRKRLLPVALTEELAHAVAAAAVADADTASQRRKWWTAVRAAVAAVPDATEAPVAAEEDVTCAKGRRMGRLLARYGPLGLSQLRMSNVMKKDEGDGSAWSIASGDVVCPLQTPVWLSTIPY